MLNEEGEGEEEEEEEEVVEEEEEEEIVTVVEMTDVTPQASRSTQFPYRRLRVVSNIARAHTRQRIQTRDLQA